MDKKIENMSYAAGILSDVLTKCLEKIAPGVTELEIDALAEKLIRERGAEPGFKKVPGYHHTICVSTNDVVVHGIPTERVFKKGDIVGIDCGVYFGGYHTDMAQTKIVGGASSKIQNFLRIGEQAMFEGIKQAKAGNHVGEISRAIQKVVEDGGYSVVRSLVGHGVGKQLHEPPEIPGYLSKAVEATPKLILGQTIAVEVIYNMGQAGVVYDNEDDWTIATEDGSLSGLFERTILVTEGKPRLLTALKGDVKKLA